MDFFVGSATVNYWKNIKGTKLLTPVTPGVPHLQSWGLLVDSLHSLVSLFVCLFISYTDPPSRGGMRGLYCIGIPPQAISKNFAGIKYHPNTVLHEIKPE